MASRDVAIIPDLMPDHTPRFSPRNAFRLTYIRLTMSTASLPQPPTSGSAADSWALGPPQPRLAEGTVHVWRANLEAVEDDLGTLLCTEERSRAKRFLNERDRRLWTRSRGVLRALLGRYLQQDPRTLRFALSIHGKPELLGDATLSTVSPPPASAISTRVSFNLSHSRGRALYAFTTASAVGVDLELARRPIDAVAIARRAFGAAEAERLAGLDPEVREQEFLRAWVRHEAELKFLGAGIGAGASAVGGRAGWIAELDIGPRGAAAVAGRTRPSELRCWAWR
jgi:4'-phosphopantetheinyl transferase